MNFRPALGKLGSMTDDLLTYKEAARLAHVSPETVKYWRKTGRLEGVPVGKGPNGSVRRKVRRQDLIDCMVHKKLQRWEAELGSKLLSTREVACEFDMTYNQARRMARILELKKYQPYADRTTYYSYNELCEKMENDLNYYMYLAPHELRLKRLACGCKFCYS